MSTPTTTAKTSPKGAKKSRVIVLRLSPQALAQYPSDVPRRKASSSSSSTKKPEPSPSVVPPESTSADKTSESNGTPVPPAAGATPDPSSLAPPPKVDGRRKRGGGAVAGRKRAPPVIDPDAPPRERGRPGPKKKPRLPDGTIDRSHDGAPKRAAVTATPGAIPAHKLGPKANTGAINAGLRALDRSGKPCRKWERKGLQLKSFTGATWAMPSWKAPERSSSFAGDVKSDSTGSSELKPNGSSALPSERSNSGNDGGDVSMLNGIESSPAPPIHA